MSRLWCELVGEETLHVIARLDYAGVALGSTITAEDAESYNITVGEPPSRVEGHPHFNPAIEYLDV